MKHKGCKCDFSNERDLELFRTYKRILSESKFIKLPELMEKLVNSPTKRFWVSEPRVAYVLSDMFKGKPLPRMHKLKEEMFREMFRRAVIIKNIYPTMSISDVAFKVVNQPAPKFYMQPSTAKIYIHYIKKKWYAKSQLGQQELL